MTQSDEITPENTKEPNWRVIAYELSECLVTALRHLHAKGGGILVNRNDTMDTGIHWRNKFANAIELIPGITVDREMSFICDLPRSQQEPARKKLLEKRKLKGLEDDTK